MTKKKKHWYSYLWIWSIVYFSLGFFNILFAWLGLIDFILPLIFAIAGGNKWFCNNMCGRGQLFWTFRLPWNWAYSASSFPDWVAQFGFGFYSLMLTSTLIGLIVMVLYKERTWCTFCPMGTMTQGICKMKEKGASK